MGNVDVRCFSWRWRTGPILLGVEAIAKRTEWRYDTSNAKIQSTVTTNGYYRLEDTSTGASVILVMGL